MLSRTDLAAIAALIASSSAADVARVTQQLMPPELQPVQLAPTPLPSPSPPRQTNAAGGRHRGGGSVMSLRAY